MPVDHGRRRSAAIAHEPHCTWPAAERTAHDDTAASRRELPPGPTWPALLQTLRFSLGSVAFLTECQRLYGETFTIRLFGVGQYVMFTSPRDIEELYRGDPEVLRAGEGNSSLLASLIGSRATLSVDGAEHLRRRRMLLSAFHGDRVHLYGDIAREVTEETMAKWPLGRRFKLLPDLERMTLRITIRSIFDVDGGEKAGSLANHLVRVSGIAVNSILNMIPPLQWDLGRYSPWGRVMHVVREADRVFYAEIARRRADPETVNSTDIVSVLINATDQDGQPLTDLEIRDEVISLLVAGKDTTSKSLAWTLERILSAPEVEERIRAELDTVLDGRPPDAESAPRLVYLEAAIKEALRVRPITSIAGGRRLTVPYTIGGYRLPAGVTAAACNVLLHRRPDVYPDPLAFRPERFLHKVPNPYEWIPFGGGPRRCAGMAFALYQMKMVLATLFSRCRLRLTTPNLRPSQKFLLTPSGGLEVTLLERSATT